MYVCTCAHQYTLIHSYEFKRLCVYVLYVFTYMELRTFVIVLIRMYLCKVRVFYLKSFPVHRKKISQSTAKT